MSGGNSASPGRSSLRAHFELLRGAHRALHHPKLQPWSCFLGFPGRCHGGGVASVVDGPDPLDGRHELLQSLNALRHQLGGQVRHAGDVPARVRELRDDSDGHWISHKGENDGDLLRGVLGCLGGSLVAGKEQIDLGLYQGGRGGIRGRRIALGEVDVERDVPALFEPQFFEPGLESLDGGVVRRRRLVEHADAVGTARLPGVGLRGEKHTDHRECTQRANRAQAGRSHG